MSIWRTWFGPLRMHHEAEKSIEDALQAEHDAEAEILADAQADIDALDRFAFTDTDLLRKCYGELRMIRAHLEAR